MVVLSNSFNDIDDIGRHLLIGQYPLAKFEPPREHKEIKLDAKTLDQYVGEYQLVTGFSITIGHEGDQLTLQPTGQSKLELFAESEKDFFLKVTNAQVTFVKDDKGAVTHLILHQNGVDQRATKVK